MRVAPDPLPPRPPAEIRAAAEHNIQVSLTPDETLGIFAELERLRARVYELERDARDVVAAYEAGYGTKDEILALRATLGTPVDR